MRRVDFEEIQRCYNFACGYCQVTEIEVGSELTIDHYKPRAADGTDDLDNLVYACQRCNLNKRDFWPTTADLALGHRVLHPLIDNFSQHFSIDPQNGYVTPLTETGHFHVTLLQLNRPQLVKRRLAKQLNVIMAEKQKLLEQQVTEMGSTIEAQQRYINILRSLFEQLQR